MDYVLYIVRRLLAAVPVLFGVTIIVFFMIHMVPGNPAATLLGSHATTQGIAALDKQLGLNKPVWNQYLDFLDRLLHGNLGHSYFYNASVTSLILHRISATIWLIVAGAIFAVVISVPLAVWAASRRNSVADNVIRAVPLFGLGMPSFWLGIMLVLVFGLKIHLFPVSGFGTTIPEHLRSIVLPGLTVALSLVPILIRSLRTSMIDVLASDYITTARAKGLSGSRVAFGHALRNAAVSSVTVLGVNIAYLIGSTLVIETVFSLPGIGILMVEAIFDSDFPVVQGVTMVFAVLVVIVNLLTDIAHASLDPRVRLNP
jgi:peptide/nickel transport system permease protein